MLCTGETVSVVCAGACGLRPVSLWYDCTTAPACTTTRSHHFQYHHTRAPTPPRVPLHRTRTRHRAPLAPAPLPEPPRTLRDTARHRIHAPTPLPRARHCAPFTCARHRHNELHRASRFTAPALFSRARHRAPLAPAQDTTRHFQRHHTPCETPRAFTEPPRTHDEPHRARDTPVRPYERRPLTGHLLCPLTMSQPLTRAHNAYTRPRKQPRPTTTKSGGLTPA